MDYVLIAILCLAAGLAAGWYAARARAATENAAATELENEGINQ